MTSPEHVRSAMHRDLFLWGAVYAFALLLVRVLQLFAIAWFTGGAEFAEDVRIQQVYTADPLQLLLGRAQTYDVFPPLFPIVLWTLHTPLSWVLSPFYAMRMTMCVVELLAWPLLWWTIATTVPGRGRHLLAMSYLLAPVGWVTSIIMCQDEMISMAVFAGVVVALLKNRPRLAILLCGVGVVVAKIYFLVPLVGLLGMMANRTWKEWLHDVVIGVAPIAVIYGLQALLTGRPDVAVEALNKFVIPFQMSVNIWGLIHSLAPISDEQARRISAMIAFSLSMAPLLMIRLRGKPPSGIEQIQVIVAMMLWVYASFFHINPEYYLIVVPGILVAFRPIVASTVLMIGFSPPWAVNFFYGVGVGMERGDPGRAAFVRAYRAIFAADPSVMQGISIVLATAVTLWLAWILTWRLREPGRIASMDPS